MPNCKIGDMAFIKKSMNLKNVGLIIECKSYIGKFSVGEEFSFHGVASVPIKHGWAWWLQTLRLVQLRS